MTMLAFAQAGKGIDELAAELTVAWLSNTNTRTAS
jgi:hypothetical protein